MSMILEMLTSTATIKRKTEMRNTTSGYPAHSWATSSSGNICAIQAGGGSEFMRASRETGSASYTGFFLPGTDILNGDVVIPSSGPHLNRVLHVVSIAVDNADQTDHLVVQLSQQDGDALL